MKVFKSRLNELRLDTKESERVRKYYFNNLAGKILKNTKELGKKTKKPLRTTKPFELAAKFVGNFLSENELVKTLEAASFETGGYIPTIGYPINIYQDLQMKGTGPFIKELGRFKKPKLQKPIPILNQKNKEVVIEGPAGPARVEVTSKGCDVKDTRENRKAMREKKTFGDTIVSDDFLEELKPRKQKVEHRHHHHDDERRHRHHHHHHEHRHHHHHHEQKKQESSYTYNTPTSQRYSSYAYSQSQSMSQSRTQPPAPSTTSSTSSRPKLTPAQIIDRLLHGQYPTASSQEFGQLAHETSDASSIRIPTYQPPLEPEPEPQPMQKLPSKPATPVYMPPPTKSDSTYSYDYGDEEEEESTTSVPASPPPVVNKKKESAKQTSHHSSSAAALLNTSSSSAAAPLLGTTTSAKPKHSSSSSSAAVIKDSSSSSESDSAPAKPQSKKANEDEEEEEEEEEEEDEGEEEEEEEESKEE